VPLDPFHLGVPRVVIGRPAKPGYGSSILPAKSNPEGEIIMFLLVQVVLIVLWYVWPAMAHVPGYVIFLPIELMACGYAFALLIMFITLIFVGVDAAKKTYRKVF
jgi:hypothetical protein